MKKFSDLDQVVCANGGTVIDYITALNCGKDKLYTLCRVK